MAETYHFSWQAPTDADYVVLRANTNLSGTIYQAGDVLPQDCDTHQDGAMLRRLLRAGVLAYADEADLPPWRRSV